MEAHASARCRCWFRGTSSYFGALSDDPEAALSQLSPTRHADVDPRRIQEFGMVVAGIPRAAMGVGHHPRLYCRACERHE